MLLVFCIGWEWWSGETIESVGWKIGSAKVCCSERDQVRISSGKMSVQFELECVCEQRMGWRCEWDRYGGV